MVADSVDCLPECLIPVHHFADGSVAAPLHALLIFQNGGLDNAVFLFVLGLFGGAVGLIAPALGQVNQHFGEFLRIQKPVKPLCAQLIGRHHVAFVIQMGHFLLGEHPLLHQQIAYPLQAVTVPAKSAPCAAGIPAGRCKALACLLNFGGFKHPNAQVDDTVWCAVLVIAQNRPADGRNTDVQSQCVVVMLLFLLHCAIPHFP